MRLSRKFAHEGAIREIERLLLRADRRIGEVDVEIASTDRGAGDSRAQPLARVDLHRRQNLDRAHRLGQTAQPAVQYRAHEWRGGSVEDRHFRPVDLDERIMDAASRESRHDVLDGRTATPAVFTIRVQRGECSTESQIGRDNRVAEPNIGALEPHAVIRDRRTDGHAGGTTRMQADTVEGDGGIELWSARQSPIFAWGSDGPFASISEIETAPLCLKSKIATLVSHDARYLISTPETSPKSLRLEGAP